ncbi:MAG: hypothetical protein ACRD26_20735 [Vicinamibacterales bacterium]
MQKHLMLTCAGAFLLTAGVAAAEQATPAAPAQAAPLAPAKFVAPIRGQAELGYLKPVIKREKNGDVVTVIKVKNLSTSGAIAGLRVDENWYDKAGDPVTGDTFRYRKPLQPGEVIEITLRTPYNKAMDRNSYNFTHANGTIKTKQMQKF